MSGNGTRSSAEQEDYEEAYFEVCRALLYLSPPTRPRLEGALTAVAEAAAKSGISTPAFIELLVEAWQREQPQPKPRLPTLNIRPLGGPLERPPTLPLPRGPSRRPGGSSGG